MLPGVLSRNPRPLRAGEFQVIIKGREVRFDVAYESNGGVGYRT
jgi:hypothetical protein